MRVFAFSGVEGGTEDWGGGRGKWGGLLAKRLQNQRNKNKHLGKIHFVRLVQYGDPLIRSSRQVHSRQVTQTISANDFHGMGVIKDTRCSTVICL